MPAKTKKLKQTDSLNQPSEDLTQQSGKVEQQTNSQQTEQTQTEQTQTENQAPSQPLNDTQSQQPTEPTEGTEQSQQVEQPSQKPNFDFETNSNPSLNSKENFYKHLQGLLNDNTKWMEQVKLSLSVLVDLYGNFLQIEKHYDTNLKACQNVFDHVKETYQNLLSLSDKVESIFKDKHTQALEFLNQINQSKEETQEALDHAKYLMHEMEVYVIEIENYKVKIEIFRERLNDIDASFTTQKNTLENFKNEFEKDKVKLTTFLNDLNKDLLSFKDTLATEKENLTNSLKEAKEEFNLTIEEAKVKLQEQSTQLELTAKSQFTSLYKHILNIEKVLINKNIVSLEDDNLKLDIEPIEQFDWYKYNYPSENSEETQNEGTETDSLNQETQETDNQTQEPTEGTENSDQVESQQQATQPSEDLTQHQPSTNQTEGTEQNQQQAQTEQQPAN